MKKVRHKPGVQCFNCERPDHFCDYVECFEIPIELYEECEGAPELELELPRRCGLYRPVRETACQHCGASLDDYTYRYEFWLKDDVCLFALCENCFTSVPVEDMTGLYCTC